MSKREQNKDREQEVQKWVLKNVTSILSPNETGSNTCTIYTAAEHNTD